MGGYFQSTGPSAPPPAQWDPNWELTGDEFKKQWDVETQDWLRNSSAKIGKYTVQKAMNAHEDSFIKTMQRAGAVTNADEVEIAERLHRALHSQQAPQDKYASCYPAYDAHTFALPIKATREDTIVMANGSALDPLRKLAIYRKDFIDHHLDIVLHDSSKNNFYIPGHFAQGKTNLLHQMFLGTKEVDGLAGIHFDLQGCANDFDAAINLLLSIRHTPRRTMFHREDRDIIEAIAGYAADSNLSPLEIAQASFNPSDNTALANSLNKSGKKLILFIDEAQHLENPQDTVIYNSMFNFFRSITRGNSRGDVAIVCSSVDLALNRQGQVSPFHNVPWIPPYFSDRELALLVNNFLEAYKLSTSNAGNLVKIVLHRTDGHPSLSLGLLYCLEKGIREQLNLQDKDSSRSLDLDQLIHDLAKLDSISVLREGRLSTLITELAKDPLVGPLAWSQTAQDCSVEDLSTSAENSDPILTYMKLGFIRWDGQQVLPACRVIREYVLQYGQSPTPISPVTIGDDFSLTRLVATALENVPSALFTNKRTLVNAQGMGHKYSAHSEKLWQYAVQKVIDSWLGTGRYVVVPEAKRLAKWEGEKSGFVDTEIVDNQDKVTYDVEYVANTRVFGEEKSVAQHLERQETLYWTKFSRHSLVVAIYAKSIEKSKMQKTGMSTKVKREDVSIQDNVMQILSDNPLIRETNNNVDLMFVFYDPKDVNSIECHLVDQETGALQEFTDDMNNEKHFKTNAIPLAKNVDEASIMQSIHSMLSLRHVFDSPLNSREFHTLNTISHTPKLYAAEECKHCCEQKRRRSLPFGAACNPCPPNFDCSDGIHAFLCTTTSVNCTFSTRIQPKDQPGYRSMSLLFRGKVLRWKIGVSLPSDRKGAQAMCSRVFFQMITPKLNRLTGFADMIVDSVE
eukprot:CAMPEP_0117435062 /NCGR_PEP_ID=MMETSP0759-20121206/278_1 /TAXON_ID=63605 /ORGANISM="Percolomonas cosmopolitus, Strain WS" /LENGTH=907 /DNA_ID=CAMNT_0005226579 /DNA_START=195 /DNA_END=2919 /DNA_ORIENTATION=+